MKTYLAFIRVYLRVLNVLNSKMAAERAFSLFQKTRKLKFKNREQSFYDRAHQFVAPSPVGDIPCYEVGDPTGKLVILVHGWESNAGSMAGIGEKLVNKGYHVVSMDLPAHGHHLGSHTNLFECKEAVKAVIKRVWPAEPFSIVSHSFGSAVTTFALSEMDLPVDQLIYLTSPNELSAIFEHFRDMVKLPTEPYNYIIEKVHDLFGEGIINLTVQEKAKQMDYQHLTMIHDINDKVLPYINSQNISNFLPRTELYTLENAGHYRMLWNDEVYTRILKQFEPAVEYSEKLVEVA